VVLCRGFVVEKGKLVVLQVCNHSYCFVLVEQETDCLVKCKVDLVVCCCLKCTMVASLNGRLAVGVM
jgi:hypothetical protein